MLGRKQEFNIKLNQLIDSLLLAVAGVASHALRASATAIGWSPIPDLREFQFMWVLAIVVPFLPLILEMNGYYKHPSQKTVIKSFQQILSAAIWIGLALGTLAIFAKYEVGARGFLPIYGVLGVVVLLVKESILRAHLKRRSLRGEKLEHVLLVGPRPLAYYEAENVNDSAQRRRFSVKPGLTCLWQVSGRNDIKDFSDWVRLDLEYIDNWSIWLDLKILILTIPAVLMVKGAK